MVYADPSYSVEISSHYWLFKKLVLNCTEVRFTSISLVNSLLWQSSSDILRRPPKFGISSTFFTLLLKFIYSKGQLISKEDWCTIDSPKKRTDEFVLFTFLLFRANKSNFSVCFLGESTARQSAFRFYLTFKKASKFCEIFPLLLTVCTAVKSKGKILQNFVAFSEYMNFTVKLWQLYYLKVR